MKARRSRPSVLVVGGGIAGFSLAMHATRHFDTTLVEAEFQPGYHSTGRSAAVFHIAFESDTVHRLSLESESFFLNPPKPFGTVATSLENMMIAKPEERNLVDSFMDTWLGRCPWLQRLNGKDITTRIPVIRSSFQEGVLDKRSLALDVHALLEGYRRSFVENDGEVMTNRRLVELDDSQGHWKANFAQGESIETDIVVNAAGAWADEVANLAGVKPLGLVPRRRTGLRIQPNVDFRNWPMCYRATGDLYFKPEGNSIMMSPADATESPPCDAQPEILDMALAMERLQECTSLAVDRPHETWAGLRSFVADELPVIGFAKDHPGFFWHAAFAGFGVQTSPACGRLAAELLNGESSPLSVDIAKESVSPVRLTSAP